MMQTVGIREFRADIAHYTELSEPVQITKHGKVIGTFIPERPKSEFDIDKYRASVAAFRQQLADHGIDPEEIVADFDARRHKNRNHH
jgi:antitoxin (DNA-binding transcriptional repressor) of toxin-antitoxin stability system